MTEKLYHTHAHMLEDLREIIQQIESSEYIPDYIVGIARGGLIPAVYLSHYFNKPFHAIHYSLRDGKTGGEVYTDAENFLRVFSNEGKKFLIVDDIADSGVTLKEILKQIGNIEQHRLAVLHYNVDQDNVTPDYFGRKMHKATDPKWIVYDWEEWADK
jgi:uncharacterized protein